MSEKFEVNWDNVEDAKEGDGGSNYPPIPDGWYLCGVAKVTVEKSQNSGDYWKMELHVKEGEYKGRKIWDTIFFTPKALPRAKLICSRFGLKTVGVMNMTPDDLVDRGAWVQTEIESYDHNGEEKKKNGITFSGYKPFDEPPDHIEAGSSAPDGEEPAF